MKRRFLLILIISSFVLYANIGLHALMVEVSLEDLAEKAELIVHGKVNKIWSDWNDDRSVIYTYVVMGMTDLLKGEGQPLNQLTLRFPGGEVGGIGMAESDMPRFETGEEAILFLQRKKDRYYRLIGNFQGKFRVEDDKLTHKKIVTQAGYSIAKRVEGRLVLDSRTPGRVFLPNFKKTVREIIREQFQKKQINR